MIWYVEIENLKYEFYTTSLQDLIPFKKHGHYTKCFGRRSILPYNFKIIRYLPILPSF